MTRILAIADEVDEALIGDKLDRLRPDVVVSCGDLPFDYLEHVAGRVDVPLLFVPGNHDPDLRSDPTWTPQRIDSPTPGPQGCENIDGRAVSVAGLRIAGLGGSMRYKRGPNQYSDAEMRWRALRLRVRIRLNPARSGRRLDVLLTHAPPLGWGVPDDPAHRGFAAFVSLAKDLSPKLLIHGHIHPYGRGRAERRLGVTRIVNAVPFALIEL